MTTKSSKPNEEKAEKRFDNPADFETAISATKLGKFNIFLFGMSMFQVLTSSFETTSLSFVFPIAKCDLNLSLENRGLLNSMTYVGMISSCFLWGFLMDTLGRKKILILCPFLDLIFLCMTALSQNYAVFIVAKFFGGFIINGSTATLPAYLSEFHGMKYRLRVQLLIGIIYCTANVILPLMAWAVLPLDLTVTIYEGKYVLHAWNIFLFLGAISAIICGVIFIFMPETPKFLMTHGKNEEALENFRKIYKWNTGKPKETYPIICLINEKSFLKDKDAESNMEEKSTFLKNGLKQVLPLFSTAVHLKNLILVCALETFFMMNINTVRLWVPQIFQAFSDYDNDVGNETTSNICQILDLMNPQIIESDNSTICLEVFSTILSSTRTESSRVDSSTANDTVFINTTLTIILQTTIYFVAGFSLNRFGKKKILVILAFVAGLCGISIYFTQGIIAAILLISVNLATASVCIDVVIGATIDLFPTYLRGSALSLALMFGRIGSVLGNLIYPVLLQIGCAPPFFTFSFLLIGCALLSLLLPNSDKKPLE